VKEAVPTELLKQAEYVGRPSSRRQSSFTERTRQLSAGIARNCETARTLMLYPKIELPIVQKAPTFAKIN
jgi:hypothetical protein